MTRHCHIKLCFAFIKLLINPKFSLHGLRGMFLTYEEPKGPAKHLYSSVHTLHVWVKACTLRGIIMLIMQFSYIKYHHVLLIGLFLGFSKLTLHVF